MAAPISAYYGDPEVLYNLGTGWSAPKPVPIADGHFSPNALATGDLHRSPGLVLLGDNNLYYIAQNADTVWPEKIPFSGAWSHLQVLDIDGDRRDDLLLTSFGKTPNPFRIRLPAGKTHFLFPPSAPGWPMIC